MTVARVLPLSPTQHAMLVHELAFPESTVLRSQLRLRVDGVLDFMAFDRAWQSAIERHGMLRAAVISQQVKQPVQVIADRAAFACRVEDWRALPGDEQARRHAAFLDDDRRAALPLTRPPLMRVSVLRLADDVAEVIWTSHHIVLDRACIGLVLAEVARLYDGFVGGEPTVLEEPGDFGAYLTWHQGQDVSALDRFWSHEFAGLSTSFRLSEAWARAVGPRPAESRLDASHPVAPHRTRSTGFESHKTRRVGSALAATIRAVARTHRLTLSTLVLGAWASVLARRTGTLDGTVGVTFSGRPVEVKAAEETVGSFSVNLPVRIQLTTDLHIIDWLRALQGRLAACHDHAAVDPSRLRALAALPSDEPLFDCLFVFQSAFHPPSFSSSLRWSPCGGTFSTAFPFAIMVSDLESDLEVVLVDRTDGGERELEGLMAGLVERLTSIAADPRRRLSAWLSQGGETVQPAGRASRPREGSPNETDEALALTPIEARLLRLWCRVLDSRRIDLDVGFFDAGGTSLQAIALIEAVRREFGHGIPLATFIQAPSIRAMAQQVPTGGATVPWRCIVPIQPKGAARPVFLVHHGGGGVLDYLPLARALGGQQPLFGLQEPGFDEGTVPPESLVALAQSYVAEMRTVQPHGPYVVGGFCFGGVVAFEMAQQLRQEGEQVDAVVVIDGLAAALQTPRPLTGRVGSHVERMRAMALPRRLSYLLRRVGRRCWWALVSRAYRLRDRWRELLYQGYRRLGLREPELLRQWHLLRINGQLSQLYEPRPYEGRVVLIRSHQPDMAPDFGWNRAVTPAIEICEMPTDDHLTMLKEPHVRVLADHVRRIVGSTGDGPRASGNPSRSGAAASEAREVGANSHEERMESR